MKKIKTLIVFIIIINSLTIAQSPFRIGAGFNIIFPTGDFADLAKTGTGGSLLIDYTFTPKFAISLSSSFSSLKSKIPQIGAESSVVEFYIKSFDVRLGGRYYFDPSFFGLAEAGVKYLQLHADIYNATSNSNEKASTDYEPYFAATGGLGYKYNLAEGKSDFELTGLYQFVSGDVINFPNFILRASIMIYL